MTRARHGGSSDEVSIVDPQEPTVYEIAPGRHRRPVETRRRRARWWLVGAGATVAGVLGLTQLLPTDQGPRRNAGPTVPTVATPGVEPTMTFGLGEPSPGEPTVASGASPTLTLTSAPAPTPTRKGQGPKSTRSPKPTKSPKPSVAPTPKLSISTTTLNLRRRGSQSMKSVRLSASGATIGWTATALGEAARWLSVEDTSGTLAAGESVDVGITVDPDSPDSVTELQVLFDPGNLVLTVLVTN